LDINRKIALLAVVIAAIMGSVLVARATFTATVYADSENNRGLSEEAHANFPMRMGGQGMATWGGALHMQRGFNAPSHWGWGSSGNVTMDSAQAKALVEADMPSFKTGTITALRNGWLVPIEDANGVVTSIQVTTVSAPTAEQAKGVVEDSMNKGWKAGEPQLVRTIYNIPLLDSNNATIGYVRADGVSGEIIRAPSTILTVTSDQAKTLVDNAIGEFKAGDAEDRGNLWTVSIKYKDGVVMTVVLGKLNTPTSADAVKAVQESLGKGWSAGEPRQLRLTYNVPIIDSNGNAIGSIMVDGRNGNITAGFPTPCR